MKKTKKALTSLVIACMVLTIVPFNAFATGTVPTRLAGTTAAQTAVAIADQTGWTGTAILASSASYGMVDALTSGPLAKFLNAPILLQEPGAVLNADTKAELIKLAVSKVYVTSGTVVISQAVLDTLAGMGITVESLGGFDRVATSVNIAKKMVGVTKVAIANGLQDALSIASIASAANEPILLTGKDALPLSVKAFLAENPNITTSDVIGGTGIISDTVKASLPIATRHAGMTAYDTNYRVIQDFASALTFDNVYVSNGVTGIDALSGAPLAAITKSAIVLTNGKSVPAVAAFISDKASDSTVDTALGGEAVIPETIRMYISHVAPVPADYSYTVIAGKAQITKYKGAGVVVTTPSTIDGFPVTSIGNGAFAGCTGLSSIIIDQGINSIGDSAFAGCTGLTGIAVTIDNQNYASIDGVLYNREGTMLIACPGSLTTISIPHGVTSIGKFAFSGCKDLSTVSIPHGVTAIGEGAFSDCTGITTISLPETVTSIDGWAFVNCRSLTGINIPEGVKSIGNNTFSVCLGLTSLSIPESVTSIGNYAFSYCEGLTTIKIPKNVTSIGEVAFHNCPGLTSIKVAVNNLNYSSKDGVLYNEAGSNLVACPGGLTTLSIPQGVTSIGDAAIFGCRRLTTLSIPQGVTSIGTLAISSCTGLTTITIPESVTSIGNSAFDYCTGLTAISIPKGVINIGSSAFFECPSLATIRLNSATTTLADSENTISQTAKIIGLDPSTAKDYATKYNRTFEVINTANTLQ